MQHSKERLWVIRGLVVSGLILSVVAAYTDIPAGGADNYAHFNISKWAFRYPHLFLDHWGKPVFTILTAPFAQMGFLAVRIFNIIAGLLTAWFCYKMAVHFNLKAAWFAPVVAVFTPIYFVMMSSGMTEVLFSLFLVVSIYLFFKENYILSAIIISFLFLVRSEGLAFLAFFFIALLIRKKYHVIPFLLSGFILFGLIGWIFHYHDFWWLINKRPYSTGAPNVYGSGEWYHYLKFMPLYYGSIVPVFLFTGTVILLIRWIKINFKLTSDSFLLLLLVLGSFWGYLFIHSFLWWMGNTSAGLDRVMAGVSPLIGIMAAFTVNAVAVKVDHKKTIYAILLLLPAIYLTGAAAKYYQRSIGWSLTNPVLTEATQFLIKPENKKHKLVVHNPYFAFSTGRDAWNNNEIQYGFSDNNTAGNNLPDSTLFVWDAHFSANEGHMPLEMIMKNQDFELIGIFSPETPFIVLGGNQYQILVFRKLSGIGRDNEMIYNSMQKEGVGTANPYTEEFTFEQPFKEEKMEERRISKAENGSGFVYNLEGVEFSPTFHIPSEEIDKGVVNKIRASAEFFIPHQLDQNQLLMVFSVEEINKVHHYTTLDFAKQNLKYGVWEKTDFIFFIPPKLEEGSVLKLYIWNIGGNKVLIDNFKAEIFQNPI